jgi:GntR family transcriptional regulator, transcriptional repressor for pyruvate dehydrogenase complex
MAVIHLKPAKRERLADVLYGQLLEQIANGRFREGDRLPSESQICEAFGVSRPIVREAIARLQADGVVVSRQGAGTFVKRCPPAELFQVARSADVSAYLRGMEARVAVETETARLAALRCSKAQLQRIEAAMVRFHASLNERKPAVAEDFDFHIAIAEASGNDLFVQFLELIRDQVLGQMSMALGLTQLGSDARRQQVAEEHRRIVKAIAEGDGDAAAMFMRYHLFEARSRMTDAQRTS